MSKPAKTKNSNGLLVGKDDSGKYNGDHEWTAIHDGEGSSESAPLWLNGEVVALVVLHNKSLWANLSKKVDANALRLVACWNACDGISTENLQDNESVKALAEKYNSVIAQRDELLAVLSKTANLIDDLNSAYGSEEIDKVSKVAHVLIDKIGGAA